VPWFWQGLRATVRTLPVMDADGLPRGVTPGRPVTTPMPAGEFDADPCPTGALTVEGDQIVVRLDACVYCQRCRLAAPAMGWRHDYDWARMRSAGLPAPFRRSIHVRIVDAGDCGACLNEIRQLASRVYSLHRFGVYVTPTPRDADVLLVVGPVTVGMKTALEESYAAMPEPKRVVAVGVCALNGGVFAGSFAALGGAAAVVPVDVTVPGCPPPPLAILQALRRVMGQRGSVAWPMKEGHR
jgi:Ni,Fe-hydrogenase III small subunit